MWGWLSGIADWLKAVWEAVTVIPEKISEFATSVGDWFIDLGDKLLSLPSIILDGIKGIFIPDTGYIQERFDSFLADTKMRFGINTDVFRDIFQGEQPVEDVKGDYQISGVGTFNLTFLDTSFFREGITYFRPLVRGFLVLLMVLYNIRQAIGFFGYDAGVVVGRSDHIAAEKRGQVEK